MKHTLLFLPLLLMASCFDEASIQVTNNVSNVMLENIQLGQIGVDSRLLPGESTPELVVSERTEDVTFPISAQLQFYMVKGERRVFLKTQATYTLNADDNLNIVIDNDTEVVNQITE
jgi:hypothetical protein